MALCDDCNGKKDWLVCFLLLFLFWLSCLFLGIRYAYFFFLRLSNGKAPLIKIITVNCLFVDAYIFHKCY